MSSPSPPRTPGRLVAEDGPGRGLVPGTTGRRLRGAAALGYPRAPDLTPTVRAPPGRPARVDNRGSRGPRTQGAGRHNGAAPAAPVLPAPQGRAIPGDSAHESPSLLRSAAPVPAGLPDRNAGEVPLPRPKKFRHLSVRTGLSTLNLSENPVGERASL